MLLLPAEYTLIHEEQLDSTNEEMRRQLLSGRVKEKTVILADKQHAGRGRRGREWVSDLGNLYLSFLHPLATKNREINGYTLAAGLAVREVFSCFLPEKDIRWKWPNDVLIEGKKASGILLEHVSHSTGEWLITGVGMNLSSAPKSDILWPTTFLEEYSAVPVSREEILKTFVKCLDSYYKRVVAGELDKLINLCLDHAAQLGEYITVRLPDVTIEGVFEGIDLYGNLLLATDDGIRNISAGDVFFKE